MSVGPLSLQEEGLGALKSRLSVFSQGRLDGDSDEVIYTHCTDLASGHEGFPAGTRLMVSLVRATGDLLLIVELDAFSTQVRKGAKGTLRASPAPYFDKVTVMADAATAVAA